jgi:tetratricopeptide (TPR) repeat protein
LVAGGLVVVALVAGLGWRPITAWWDDETGNRALLVGNARAAAGWFERGLRLEPGWSMLHEDLGRALLSLDPAAAAHEFRQAACGDPCWAQEGDAEAALGHPDRALALYVRARAVSRVDDVAEKLARRGNFAAALQVEEALVRRLGHSFVDRAELAAAYATIGDIEQRETYAVAGVPARRAAGKRALAAFGKASRLAPLNEGYLLAWGFAEMRWGSRGKARAIFERLLSLHPGQPDAVAALAQLTRRPEMAPH